MNAIQPANQPVEKERQRLIPTVSSVLSDGRIVETLYDPEGEETNFVIWDSGAWSIEDDIQISETERLVPFSPRNNLIQNAVVLLPSRPEEYGSEQTLLAEIRNYIHRYVDLSPSFEKIASYYVLLSWVYDNFNELPYLRVRGDAGCGKTRFLQTVGALCYKPIFASGASSLSPIFRILDSVKGTLVIDESDFRFSDEKAEMIKILNNGNAKGFPVLRSEVIVQTKEFNPRAYHVFGPKLIATRGYFEDHALESRCLTEEMGQRRLRDDIPINLPDRYKDEALQLRNKLLQFRFRNFGLRKPIESLVDRTIEARLNQVFVPLLSIIQDEQARGEIQELARSYNNQTIAERGMQIEAQILEVIRDLAAEDVRLTVKKITKAFSERYGQDYEYQINPRWIGQVMRNKLGIKAQRTNEGYAIPPHQYPVLERLYERYGLAADTPPQRSPSSLRSLSSSEQSEHSERREHPTGVYPQDQLPQSSPMPPEQNPQGPDDPPANLPSEQ